MVHKNNQHKKQINNTKHSTCRHKNYQNTISCLQDYKILNKTIGAVLFVRPKLVLVCSAIF